MAKIPICTNCSAELEDGARFCSECGSPCAAPQGESNKAGGHQTSPDHAPSADLTKAKKTVAPWMRSGQTGGGLKIVGKPSSKGDVEPSGTFHFANRSAYQRVHLFAKGKVIFGRDESRSNVVLPVFSNSGDRLQVDTDKSYGISGTHFEIGVDASGFSITDLSAFGTSLNGQKLVKGTPAKVSLDRISKVDLVDLLSLRLTPVVGDSGDGSLEAYADLVSHNGQSPNGIKAGAGGLLVERLSGLEKSECYLILYDWVDLGDSFSGDHSSAGGSIRLVNRNNRIWIHNHHHEGMVRLNDIDLKRGEIASLEVNAKITFGKESGIFAPVTRTAIV